MSSEGPVVARPSTREYRLHWLSLFIGLVRSLRHVVFLLVLSFFATKREGGERLIAPLIIVTLSMAAAVARYLSFRYRYDESELVIRSGIIRRNERHIPYDRIQNIDATANVVERMFGVATVQLQTGGGRTPEGEFRVLPEAALDEMRRRVFSQTAAPVREPIQPLAAGFVDASVAVPIARNAPALSAGRTILHLSPRELLLCGFIENRVMAVVVSLWLFVSQVDRGSEVVGTKLAAWTGGWSGVGATKIVVALVAAIVVVRLASTVWELVRLYGFRLTRHGDDLRIEYGLFTRVTATIPLRRIQAITIHETLLHRLIGRAAILVSTAGGGVGHSGKQHRELLAPIIERAAVETVIEELQPGAGLAAVAWRRAHPRAVARMMRRWLLVTGVLTLVLAPFIHWWAGAIEGALIVIGFVRARLRVGRLGWGLLPDGVVFRSGALRFTTVLARFARVQAVQFDESLIDRWTGMATVSVDTAGARASGMRMPLLAKNDAAELRALVATRSAGTEFVW